ncbi:hypothetical protein RJ640_015952, partial [Escallonia rubra]
MYLESEVLKILGFMWNPLSGVMEAVALMAIGLAHGGNNYIWINQSSFAAYKPGDYHDFVGILVLLVINSTISFIEENNAGNAAAALMARLAPKAKDAVMLVPGDIVSIKLGDIVPADARFLEEDPLKIDQVFDSIVRAHIVSNVLRNFKIKVPGQNSFYQLVDDHDVISMFNVYETEDVIDVYVTGVKAVPQMVVNPSTFDPHIVNLPTGDPPNVETPNVKSEESISIDEEYNEEEPVRSDPDAGGGMSDAVGERATVGGVSERARATVGGVSESVGATVGEGATVGGVGKGATVGGDGVHGEGAASRGRGRGLTRGRGRSPARSRGRGATVLGEGAGGDGVHGAGSVNGGATSRGRGRAPARGRGRGATVGKGVGGDGVHGAGSANDGATSRGRGRGLARGRGRATARGGDCVVGEGAGGDGVHGAGSVNDAASLRGKGRGFRVRGRGTDTLN